MAWGPCPERSLPCFSTFCSGSGVSPALFCHCCQVGCLLFIREASGGVRCLWLKSQGSFAIAEPSSQVIWCPTAEDQGATLNEPVVNSSSVRYMRASGTQRENLGRLIMLTHHGPGAECLKRLALLLWFCSPGTCTTSKVTHSIVEPTVEPGAPPQSPWPLHRPLSAGLTPPNDILLVLIFQVLPMTQSPARTTESNFGNCQKKMV